MIAIFGGTTEGRVAAAVCDNAAKGYIYATKGGDQQLMANHAERLTGAMEASDIRAMIEARGVELIIDAAHPYADILHKNISMAASGTGCKTIRFERLSEAVEYPRTLYFETIDEVVQQIKSSDIKGVIALTGVKSAEALAPIAESHRVTLRIMDREESQARVERSGFPAERVIHYEIGAVDNFDSSIVKGLDLRAMVTKESGKSGGFADKVRLAERLGVELFVIRRPKLSRYTSTIYGEHGLRREIERLLPHHFELRTGFTTGSAATAASVAALRALLRMTHETTLTGDEKIGSVEITLPNGEPFAIEIESVQATDRESVATVIKDGGDDPDATHNIEIRATVSCSAGGGEVTICGGEGVGRVTLEGIGIAVGKAAINPVPMQMIRNNICRELLRVGARCSVAIEISVPKGAEIASKTFNPRLGIEGGVSILGTSGIVKPFSAEAFIEAIERQIDISKALGSNTIAINSGAMSERLLKAKYPDFPPQSYIHFGNMIGATIELAERKGVERVVLGVMIGKAVKLAAGAMDTHSKHTTLDREFLARLAAEEGCCSETIEGILGVTTARQLWGVVPRAEGRFFDRIVSECHRHCRGLYGGVLEIVLLGE